MEAIDYLRQHYSPGLEEIRLVKDKAHSIEFITTTNYIDAYLKPGDRILELGAATGRYSRHYAGKGYSVDAVELLESNIREFESRIEPGMNVIVRQGNALDLGFFPDDTFDITLCFGPLYHLYTETDKRRCIKEAIRVTKPGGCVYFAFLSNDAVFINWNRKNWDHLLLQGRLFDENFRLIDTPEEIFSTLYPEEMERIMADFPVSRLHTVAADGVAPMIADRINQMTDEQFAVWTAFHLRTCEKENLLGASCHLLYIARKN